MKRVWLLLPLLLLMTACDPLTVAGLLFTGESVPLPTEIAIEPLVTRLTLRPDASGDLHQAQAIVRERLEGLGLSAATVTIDDGALVVELPEVPDFEFVLATLTESGLLELVDFSGVILTYEFEGKRINTTTMQYADGLNHPESGQPFETVITGADLQNVTPVQSQFGNTWDIQFEIKPEAAEKFGVFTESHVGEYMGIVLNGYVISAPMIQMRLDSAGVITGNFSETDARKLAIQLGSHPLPFSLILENIEAID